MKVTSARLARVVALDKRQGGVLRPGTDLPDGRRYRLVAEDIPAGFEVHVRKVDATGRTLRVLVYHPTLSPKSWARAQQYVADLFADGDKHGA